MKRRLLVVPPILLGIVLVVVAGRLRDQPQRVEIGEQVVAVRVIEARELEVIPRTTGHGSVLPARSWDAIAEVGGKVLRVDSRFEAGALVPGGTEVVAIDRTEYELGVTGRAAGLRGVEAQLAELALEQSSLEARLATERRSLELAENDLVRNVQLVERGSVSEVLMEQVEREVLRQRNGVEALAGSLAVLPAKRAQLESQLDLAQSQLEGARLDLEKTRIVAPFTVRVAGRQVEAGQFVAPGTRVGVGDGVEVAEIEARLPLGRLYPLVQRSEAPELGELLDSSEVIRRLGLTAVVRVESGGLAVEWEARVIRVSPVIDAQSRTVGVIVAVDDPYRQARVGVRPALVKGMFCEVELSGRPRIALAIPQVAMHDGEVYVVTTANRLERRPVELAFQQQGWLAVAAGLEPGERVVLSDLVPAIDGMKLDPEIDSAAEKRLAAAVQ